MATVTTEAIVLRRTPFRETSQIAHFMTRDRGRLSLILKGVHRPRDRKGGGVDLLDRCRVRYTTRRSRALPPLSERRVLCHHARMRRREDLLRAGQVLVEWVLALVPEGAVARGVYELGAAYLEALDAAPPPRTVPAAIFALQGGMLRMSGFEPVLDRCVQCHREPDGHNHLLRCDLSRGGVVCGRCREGDGGTFPISQTAAVVVRKMAWVDPRRLTEVVLPEPIERDVRRFHHNTFAHLVERPPRTATASS